jgi:hypothetical protein
LLELRQPIGVSCPNANHVTSMEWVNNTSIWIQRMGRGSCNSKSTVTIRVAGRLPYINTHMRIYRDCHPSNNRHAEDFLEEFLSLLCAPSTKPCSDCKKTRDLSDNECQRLHKNLSKNLQCPKSVLPEQRMHSPEDQIFPVQRLIGQPTITFDNVWWCLFDL